MLTIHNQYLAHRAGEHSEVNYKKDFCEKYFSRGRWQLDINKVDVVLTDRRHRPILYIESKSTITNAVQHRRAVAQIVLTNKHQQAILDHVALLYRDENGHDVLDLLDCSDDSVMYNNDINWRAERPSNPSRDAIDRINDRLIGKITRYQDGEIGEFYKAFTTDNATQISITERNIATVYSAWKQEIKFRETIDDEQDLINLFLVDMLNGTRYKRSFIPDDSQRSLFGNGKAGEEEADNDVDLIREGTNLNRYTIIYNGGAVFGIDYMGTPHSTMYHITDSEQYAFFWRRYKRPPEKQEFLRILEHSAHLYSDKYRRDTGGEYTPTCFVELQNKLLREHYDMDEFIVCDPCAGVGNLENQFGKDYKQQCYLSTLEQMDVDTCRIKGFDNAVQYDYLKDRMQPKWKYKGTWLDIRDIARREQKRLMVIMNPPYQRQQGYTYDLAIEFFRKVTELQPDVIVYYCKTEFLLRDTVSVYAQSGYNIVSHVFSNAKTTFQLSEWSVSQIIFDREKGEPINPDYIKADRYEVTGDQLQYVNTYQYDNARVPLVKEIEAKIKSEATGLWLGQWTNQNYCLVLSNSRTHKQHITTGNIAYTLLLKGINFNTDAKYFETSNLTYRGTVDEIPQELYSDAIMFSQFYIGMLFTNKGQKNYIMPFRAEELGCAENDLNVLFPDDGGEKDLFALAEEGANEPFDFRKFFHSFTFSAEARALYDAALQVFRYYHRCGDYPDHDYNDSFYDITNAIMGKDVSQFRTLDTAADRRITRVKTTKGTRGFGRNTIRSVVPSGSLPTFEVFFNARDILARKINRQLVDQHLLLWERENIY